MMYARAALYLPVLALSLSIFLSGCVRREGRNSDCQWPAERGAQTLDPRLARDARHLRDDVEVAEELAIRYMDATRRSGQPAGQAWNTCFTKLIRQIGESHGVAPKDVGAFFDQRSLAVDVGVNLPLILIYGLLAWLLAGLLRRRYPPEDGWVALALLSILASLVFGAIGVMGGQEWSGTMESLRVGSGHLSYRADRLPWSRHPAGFFGLCVAIFWAAALVGFWNAALKRRAE